MLTRDDIAEQKPMYRHATLTDATGIRSILSYYIKNTMATWRYEVMDLTAFETMIKNHQTGTRPFWVAEMDHQIVGYGCLSEFRSGDGYWPCAENSVYVQPGFEGLGIGSELMRLILEQGRQFGLRAVIAAIDAENLNSIRMHEKFGFKECGRLNNIGQKKDSWRSLVLMQCNLQEMPVVLDSKAPVGSE